MLTILQQGKSSGATFHRMSLCATEMHHPPVVQTTPHVFSYNGWSASVGSIVSTHSDAPVFFWTIVINDTAFFLYFTANSSTSKASSDNGLLLLLFASTVVTICTLPNHGKPFINTQPCWSYNKILQCCLQHTYVTIHYLHSAMNVDWPTSFRFKELNQFSMITLERFCMTPAMSLAAAVPMHVWRMTMAIGLFIILAMFSCSLSSGLSFISKCLIYILFILSLMPH